MPILTLIGCIILFHLIFIVFFPRGKRFWKKVDYYWISLGLIGVIGATFNLRKEYGLAIKPSHKFSLSLVYNEFLTSAKRENHYYCEQPGFDYNLFQDQKMAREFKEAGRFFDTLYKNGERYKNLILDSEDYRFIDSLNTSYNSFLIGTNMYVLNSSQMVSFWLKCVNEEKEFLLEAEKLSKRDEFNWYLLFLSPYIFSIAIAIRITKVTAELSQIS